MPNLSFIGIAGILTWTAIYISIPAFGYSLDLLWLILSASVSALLSMLLVMPGESTIEDIVKVVILLVLGSVFSATKSEFGFIVICTAIASASGILFNHANQWIADK